MTTCRGPGEDHNTSSGDGHLDGAPAAGAPLLLVGEVQGAEAVVGDASQHTLRSRGGKSGGAAEEVLRRGGI